MSPSAVISAREEHTDLHRVGMQGTVSSKKKKMAKLKRVMAQVKKQDRREKRNTDRNFAAIQLLHDPQVGLAMLCAWPRPFCHYANGETIPRSRAHGPE